MAATLGVVVVLVGGILQLSEYAQSYLARQRGIALSAIAFEPPPGWTAAEFRNEVQYLAQWPETLAYDREEFLAQLAAGFTRHPMVATVHSLRMSAHHQVTLQLSYRQPVLRVHHPEAGMLCIAADGVVLPQRFRGEGLPCWHTPSCARPGPAGTVWRDPLVEEAVALVKEVAEAFPKESFDQLVGTGRDGWRLSNATTLVVCGQPGEEHLAALQGWPSQRVQRRGGAAMLILRIAGPEPPD